jgi:CBS domain-containing protein
MPKRVKDLIKTQRLKTVPEDATVREAVKLMFEHDFSQVTVVVGIENLVGLFNEQMFTRVFYFVNADGFLDSAVSDWMVRRPTTVRPSLTIYDAMPMLAQTYAVIVTHHDKPIGIVTDYDIAAFLAEWSEGMALVEDIETRLRGYIERVFPTENARDAALYHAFNKQLKRGDKHFRTYERLSLWEHVLLIETEQNWPRFEPYFKPKATFHHFLEPVDDIRNKVVHFRGKLTELELKTLRAAASWLESRPHVPEPLPSPDE